jgi:arylsulfatase A-like enzyme/tetratricopeptide (TPR) repeat protein
VAKRKNPKPRRPNRAGNPRSGASRTAARPAEPTPPAPTLKKGPNRKKAARGVAVLLILAAAAAFLILRPKAPAVARGDRLNVLLVTLDTTRPDHLGCYGGTGVKTPNLDALAANGVRFANAYAPVPLTLPSHASIMTGLNPVATGVHNNGTYELGADRTTLAEVLKADGYKTAAFVASFSVDSRFGLAQGFDLYDDNFQEGTPFKATNAERRAEQVYSLFSSWMDATKDEPFFAWVHFFDPHVPYNPPSPYREQFSDRPYDGEIAYMDYVFGQIMGKLRDRSLLGRTIVVVAGDHGEGLGDKGEWGHGVFLYDETLRVPLIFSAAGHLPSGTAVAPRVRLIDIMPTVLDLMKRTAPEGTQGVSLLPYIQKKRKADLDTYIETYYPRENFGWAPLTGLITKNWKYIRAPKEELYDIERDPAETNNRFAAEGKTAREMRDGLDRAVKDSLVPGASSGKRTLTSEEESRLRSLGYVGFAEKAAGEAETGGGAGEADPKDKREELKMIQDAEMAEFEGNLAGATALHEKMLALRPFAASSYVNLALVQARQKQMDAAVATLKLGLERIPGNETLLIRLGFTYLVEERTPEAFEVMGEVLKRNPKSMDALTAVAVILDNTGRKQEASAYFEQGLAIEPENKLLRTAYAGNLAKSRRLPEAIAVLEGLVKDYPKELAFARQLGIAYGMNREFDKSIGCFERILAAGPNPDALYNMALAYREKGNVEEAVRCLERYLQAPQGEPEDKIAGARQELARLKK